MAKKRANGEGNIRKRKDGRWEGRYTAGYDEKTGKRLIKNVLGKTQAEVKEKLAKAVTESETVDVRRADEYTLGTWLQTWYALYAKPHLRFSTAEYYRRGIELHIVPRIGDIPLKKLTGRDLQWLYKDLQEYSACGSRCGSGFLTSPPCKDTPKYHFIRTHGTFPRQTSAYRENTTRKNCAAVNKD